jgi:hypothetical protein
MTHHRLNLFKKDEAIISIILNKSSSYFIFDDFFLNQSREELRIWATGPKDLTPRLLNGFFVMIEFSISITEAQPGTGIFWIIE